MKVFAFVWFVRTLSAIFRGMPSIFRRSRNPALESMMVITSCTVTFHFECIRSLQHSDIAIFSFLVNGLWFTGVETGSNCAVVFEVSGSEVDVPAGARVGRTTAAGLGSFSDGIVGVSAADRVSWKVG